MFWFLFPQLLFLFILTMYSNCSRNKHHPNDAETFLMKTSVLKTVLTKICSKPSQEISPNPLEVASGAKIIGSITTPISIYFTHYKIMHTVFFENDSVLVLVRIRNWDAKNFLPDRMPFTMISFLNVSELTFNFINLVLARCGFLARKIGAWKIKMPTVKRPFGLSTHFWLR